MSSKHENNDILKTLIDKRKKLDYNSIDKKIRKRFGDQMDQWKIITDYEELKLEKGYHVRYIHNSLKEYKTALIVNVILTREKNIYRLIMKNVYSGITWTINPSCYYFYKKVNSNKSTLRLWLEEILGQNIDKIDGQDLDHLNIDDIKNKNDE